MRILVVAAMDREIEVIKNYIDVNGGYKELRVNGFSFYQGKIGENEIKLVKSGVGRVNSGILIAIAKSVFDFDLVINIGIAGGLAPLKRNDIVIGERTVYGDVDLTALTKYEYGQMSGCPKYFEGSKKAIDLIKNDESLSKDVHFGSICSREMFTTDLEEVNNLINKNFSDANILAFDMESACFAQACGLFNLDFIAIRFLSDIIGEKNQVEKFVDTVDDSAKDERCNNYVISLIEKIK